MSVHCGYRDMMYRCWYRIDISHYIRLTCGHSNSRHTMYGGRFVSKLHHTIAKLERILFMPLLLFWGIHFSFVYATFWGYALSIWVYTFYLGMHFLFGYALFIWVCTFRPSNAHALICTQRRCDRVVATRMRKSNGMLIRATE